MFRVFLLSASKGFPTYDELGDILEAARVRNKSDGITGLMIYHEGSFAHILEGPEDRVRASVERIKSDPLHTGCKVILEENTPTRMFDDWAMGFIPPGVKRDVERDNFLDLRKMGETRQLWEALQHPVIAPFIRSLHPALSVSSYEEETTVLKIA